MKLKLFDSRTLKRQGRRGRKPVADGDQVITVAPHSGRIYLSVGFVQRFSLLTNRFGLAIDEDSGRLFFYIDNDNGFRLIDHHASFYVHSKTTVTEVLTDVEDESSSGICFVLNETTIKQDGKTFYELKAQRESDSKKKAKEILKAFQAGDFKGRVKTAEVLQAERSLFRVNRIH